MMMRVVRRIARLWRAPKERERADRELSEELKSYVELLTAEKLAAGQSAGAARRAALLELGGADQVQERVREVRAGALRDHLLRDARFALRMLRRSPGFAAAAILALGLGIGVTTAIFSLVYGVLLRPLPYAEPHELHRVWMSNPAQGIDSARRSCGCRCSSAAGWRACARNGARCGCRSSGGCVMA